MPQKAREAPRVGHFVPDMAVSPYIDRESICFGTFCPTGHAGHARKKRESITRHFVDKGSVFMTVKEKTQRIIDEYGISIRAISRLANIPNSTLARIMASENRGMKPETEEKLKDGLKALEEGIFNIVEGA